MSEISKHPYIKVDTCPYCGSLRFRKHGHYKKTSYNRYKCKECDRTFIPSSGTVIHYINNREKFFEFGRIIQTEGILTCKKTAKRLSITAATAFYWRHKLLLTITDDNLKFGGEICCNDLWMIFNQKGRRGVSGRALKKKNNKISSKYKTRLILSGDEKRLLMDLVKVGKLKTRDLRRIFYNVIEKDTTILVKESKAFAVFAQEQSLKSKNVLKDGKIINNKFKYINRLGLQFLDWIYRDMRGVATKYLQLYSKYFAYTKHNTINLLTQVTLRKRDVWSTFINLENLYYRFVENFSKLKYEYQIKRKWKMTETYPVKVRLVI